MPSYKTRGACKKYGHYIIKECLRTTFSDRAKPRVTAYTCAFISLLNLNRAPELDLVRPDHLADDTQRLRAVFLQLHEDGIAEASDSIGM